MKFIAGIVIILTLLTVTAMAQSVPGPPSFPSDPSGVPIDGGLGLLAAAGGAYAWNRLRKKGDVEQKEG